MKDNGGGRKHKGSWESVRDKGDSILIESHVYDDSLGVSHSWNSFNFLSKCCQNSAQLKYSISVKWPLLKSGPL